MHALPHCNCCAAGLTLNDFIIASRMNDTDVKDLQAQKRVR